jgi:hypothetical protein
MKITPGHLARGAFIYIRQSTVDQLANNHESGLRQYGLADRARALGWTDVTVIDDDLGRSGSGVSRPGFERLLAAICEGRVGAVFAIEASRLARNGRDWHTLIEFCGLVGTVIVDEDGTYETAPSKRPVVAGHEGDDERARAVAPARPFDGSSEAEGAARRALLHGSRWLCESGSRKKSKWIPTCACARRLGWSSPVLPRCKASVRYFCRFKAIRSRYRTSTQKAPGARTFLRATRMEVSFGHRPLLAATRPTPCIPRFRIRQPLCASYARPNPSTWPNDVTRKLERWHLTEARVACGANDQVYRLRRHHETGWNCIEFTCPLSTKVVKVDKSNKEFQVSAIRPIGYAIFTHFLRRQSASPADERVTPLGHRGSKAV